MGSNFQHVFIQSFLLCLSYFPNGLNTTVSLVAGNEKHNQHVARQSDKGGGGCVLCVSVTVVKQRAGVFFHASDSGDTNSGSHAGMRPRLASAAVTLARSPPRGHVCSPVGCSVAFMGFGVLSHPRPHSSAHARTSDTNYRSAISLLFIVLK